MNNKKNKLYKILLLISIIYVIIFMFIALNSDFSSLYNTLEYLGEKQIFYKSLFIKDYICSGNLYIINPGLLVNIFNNNSIARFIITGLLSIIYILIIYNISDKYLNKNQKIILLLILLCGISKDYMLSIFLYNSFIYNVIISLAILYFCVKLFYENKKIKTMLFALLIFLLSINCFCSLYLVILPYVIVQLFFNKNSGVKRYSKLIILLFIIFFLYLFYIFLFNENMMIVSAVTINKRILSVLDILIDVFGISGGKDLISLGKNIFYPNNFSNYSLTSIYGVTTLLRFIFMIFTIIVVPIIFIKNRKQNENSINKLALFNYISLILNIFFYIILGIFAYNITDLKYFMFNYIIMFIIDIYVANKYLFKYDSAKKIIILFFVLFIIFNIMTNLIYI